MQIFKHLGPQTKSKHLKSTSGHIDKDHRTQMLTEHVTQKQHSFTTSTHIYDFQFLSEPKLQFKKLNVHLVTKQKTKNPTK